MLALPIKDPTLRRLLLEHLIEQLDHGGETLDALLAAGVEPEFLDRLRHTQSRDLIQMAQMELEIHAGFGGVSISSGLDRVYAMRRDDELREYFVRCGASVETLVQLFRLTRDDARAMRKALLPEDAQDTVGTGRPRMPSPEQRQAIHSDWLQIQRSHCMATLRERYYALHQLHRDISIAAMLATITEFSTPAAASVAPPAAAGLAGVAPAAPLSALGPLGAAARPVTRSAASKS